MLGTCAVLAAAREVGARFVFISSDKAAAPRSVMGATKRFAELAVLAQQPTRATRPIVVRFGNVLASSGSFVEVMRERIRQRTAAARHRSRRHTLLHDRRRSGVARDEGEHASARGGETFWLDMGEPVRIGDLAERLMRVATARRGCRRCRCGSIGLRPGEKLTRAAGVAGYQLMNRTLDPRIWVARQAPTMHGALASDSRYVRAARGER